MTIVYKYWNLFWRNNAIIKISEAHLGTNFQQLRLIHIKQLKFNLGDLGGFHISTI